MTYLHDGSFEGILSAVYTAFYDRVPIEAVRIVHAEHFQYDALNLAQVSETDADAAHRVAESILERFGRETFETVARAYLAEDPEFGTLVFRFLKHAYRLKGDPFDCLSNPDIMALYACYRRVARETHRMLGFIRFSELKSGVYYAWCAPTYDLLYLMAPHFKERLTDRPWVIHDTRRKMGAFCDTREIHFEHLEGTPSEFSEAEGTFKKLWQTYFEYTAIEARRNPKLQRQNMPKKYWKYLTEMQGR